MRNDFQAALARVQEDFDFYVLCQSDPEAALAAYTLSPDERATLTDPDLLAEALKPGGDLRLPTITVTISGSHDWVNRAASQSSGETEERIAKGVAAVTQAQSDEERDEAALRLMQMLG